MTEPAGTDIEGQRRYESPSEGLRALEGSYDYWTSKITDVSFQSCIALIAANWAVHSKAGALLSNSWAAWSVGTALITVLASLFGALLISECSYAEFYKAAKDPEAWAKRWEASERIESAWPFTDYLVGLGRTFTWIKAILPVISGALFGIGAISSAT